jgi:Fur family zinc uptake transcriptional regulator
MARGRRRNDGITARDQLVLDCLRTKRGPMTAYDLIDALRGEGLSAPPSVYRVLARLTERGLIHRVQSLNAFIACSHEVHSGLAVFTICDACGQVSEYDETSIGQKVADTAAHANFKMGRTTVEVTGLCAECASKPNGGPRPAGGVS